MYGKSKWGYWLQPLIPVIAWLLLLSLRPEFSLAQFISRIYNLSPTEVRLFDLAIFSMISTYALRLVDITIDFLNNVRPIAINVYFENIRTKDKDSTILDPPEGSPQRVKFVVDVEYRNEMIYKSIIKILGPLKLEVKWLGNWIVVDLDDIKEVKYTATENSFTIELSELVRYPGGKAGLVLAIVTKHTYTTTGYITADLELKGIWFKLIFKYVIRMLLIRYNSSKHTLKLQL